MKKAMFVFIFLLAGVLLLSQIPNERFGGTQFFDAVGIGTDTLSGYALNVGGTGIRCGNVVIGSQFSDVSNGAYYLDPANATTAAKLAGAVVIGGTTVTVSGTGKVHFVGDTARIVDANRTPATAGEGCNKGEVAFDADHAFFCVDTDTWKRVAIATW